MGPQMSANSHKICEFSTKVHGCFEMVLYTNENHLLFTLYCSYQNMSINVLFSGNTHAAKNNLWDQRFRRSQQISPLHTRYTGCPKVLSVCILSEETQDSLREGPGLELLFIKVHPKEKCLPGFHDDKSLDRNITWLVMDNRSQNPRSPSQTSAPRSQIPDPRSPSLARGCCWGWRQAWVDRASLPVSSC